MWKAFVVSMVLSFTIVLACISPSNKEKAARDAGFKQAETALTDDQKIGLRAQVVEILDRLQTDNANDTAEFRFDESDMQSLKAVWFQGMVIEESFRRGFVILMGAARVKGKPIVVMQVVKPTTPGI